MFATMRPNHLMRGLIALLAVLPWLAASRPALAQSGAISGIVFTDLNGNGIYDPGEQGVANVGISFSGIGAPVNGTTNADGSYFFTANLGTWTVAVTPPAGFEVVNGASKTINLATAEQSLVLDFGLRPVQVGPTSTVASPVVTGTPGILPTTGAAVSPPVLMVSVLGIAFLAGLVLLVSAWRPARK